ncbi:MAG: hypothetical protein LBU85_05775 [Treponema sp.]|jgi:hypothetical protein|nr:hypothetical protein [Treponema sp.]
MDHWQAPALPPGMSRLIRLFMATVKLTLYGNTAMKKERQIGIRIDFPAFFALELEDVYRHTDGAHRALAFPDFVGWLVGMGLEAYRQRYRTEPFGAGQENEPPETEGADAWGWPGEGLRIVH